MRNCKRPRMTNEDRDFYQIPAESSQEEIQRSKNFVIKVKELCNEKTFARFGDAMKSYQSKSITYIELKAKITFILRDHDVVLQEFHQLLSDLAVIDKNRNTKKSDVERTVDILNNVQALGKELYSEFLHAFALGGDIQALIDQLDVVLRNHTSLKEKFKAFLIDSRLLKKPKHEEEEEEEEAEEEAEQDCMKVTDSYWIRPEFVEEEDEIINTKYVSKGKFNASTVKEKVHTLQEKRMNNLEDRLFKDDRYFHALESVVDFGTEASQKNPPVTFKEVVKRFYEGRGKTVPQEFETNPKLAIQGILPILQSKLTKMTKTRDRRTKEIYDLHNNVNQ